MGSDSPAGEAEILMNLLGGSIDPSKNALPERPSRKHSKRDALRHNEQAHRESLPNPHASSCSVAHEQPCPAAHRISSCRVKGSSSHTANRGRAPKMTAFGPTTGAQALGPLTSDA
jgi:hypothetical protein